MNMSSEQNVPTEQELDEFFVILRERFVRGQLSDEEVRDLPDFIPAEVLKEWEAEKGSEQKSSLAQQILIRKFKNKLTNLMAASRNCSYGTRRFRPGKEKSTLKKQVKRLKKLEKEFIKAGGGDHAGFMDLCSNAVKGFGCSD